MAPNAAVIIETRKLNEFGLQMLSRERLGSWENKGLIPVEKRQWKRS